MCELFAMSSSLPTEVSFSLNEFSKHGGLTDRHKDGWGIAYYDDNDARIIKEACSASGSAYLDFIKNRGILSSIIISHIRLATQGEVSVRNTQPFSRELAGKRHVFAHNGDFHNLEEKLDFTLMRFKPIGNTDSELAFCYLMEIMATIWGKKNPPSLAKRLKIFTLFAHEMRQYGIANFIYSDSDFIFIHSHKRSAKKEGQEPSPGLHILQRNCSIEAPNNKIDGLKVTANESQEVILVASVPLSGENWNALKEGEIKVLEKGRIIKP